MVISVTAVGFVESEKHLCPRSGAKEGDLVYLSGQLGDSGAGLKALKMSIKGFDDLKKRHLMPRCRFDVIDRIAPFASSMIDVSDGLSSELHHIARESRCGLLISEERIPVSQSVREFSKAVNKSPYDFVYSGGEDYELLYTIPKEYRDYSLGFEIGIVTKGKSVFVEREGVKRELKVQGYDHLKATTS